MIPKIKKIKFLEEYKIKIDFSNDKSKLYDASKLFDKSDFLPLKNLVLFHQGKVDVGGYGIYWNDDIDISEYEVWSNGIDL
jgi:hypothetical protein